MSDEKVQNLYLNSLLAACALVFQLGGGGGGGGGGDCHSLCLQLLNQVQARQGD